MAFHNPIRPFNSVGNNMSAEAISANLEILKPLFPQFDNGLLYIILQEKRNAVQDAIEALLEMCSDKPLARPSDTSFNSVWYQKDKSPILPAPRNPRASSFVKKPNTRAQQRRKHRNNKNLPAAAPVASQTDSNPFGVLGVIPVPTSDVDETIQFSQLAKPAAAAKPYAVSEPIPIPARVERPVVVVEEALATPVVATVTEEVPLETSLVFAVDTTPEPVAEAATPASTIAEDNGFVMLSNNTTITMTTTTTTTVTPTLEPANTKVVAAIAEAVATEAPRRSISVKLCSGSDMRRIGITANDPDAFRKLQAAAVHFLATASAEKPSNSPAKYRDEEGDLVAIHSQEEWEECVRVHELALWPAATGGVQIIRLVF